MWLFASDVVDLVVHHTRVADINSSTCKPHSILLLQTGAHHNKRDGISWSELRVLQVQVILARALFCFRLRCVSSTKLRWF